MQYFVSALILPLTLSCLFCNMSIAADIKSALSNPNRPAEDRARDADRKPQQVLEFFDIQSGQKVADLLPGSGYYTRILVNVVGEDGTVYAGNNPFYLSYFQEKWDAVLAEPAMKKVQRIDGPLDNVGLPQDGSLDAVIMVLAYHDMYLTEEDRNKMNTRIFSALKPGGVYGIIDHHATTGSGASAAEPLHRIEEETIIKEVSSAGFSLTKKGEFLRNPNDDHTKSVFSDGIRGETDRFVLRFEKPNQ